MQEQVLQQTCAELQASKAVVTAMIRPQPAVCMNPIAVLPASFAFRQMAPKKEQQMLLGNDDMKPCIGESTLIEC